VGLVVMLMHSDDEYTLRLEHELFWWRLLALALGLAWVAFAVLWWIV